MTTAEKIKSLMIPEEKAREIATGVCDVLIQVAIKDDGDGVCEYVSVHGSLPLIMCGIHSLLDKISERTEYSAPELAKMILTVAEMEGKR